MIYVMSLDLRTSGSVSSNTFRIDNVYRTLLVVCDVEFWVSERQYTWTAYGYWQILTLQKWRPSTHARTGRVYISPSRRTSEGKLIWGDSDHVPVLLM